MISEGSEIVPDDLPIDALVAIETKSLSIEQAQELIIEEVLKEKFNGHIENCRPIYDRDRLIEFGNDCVKWFTKAGLGLKYNYMKQFVFLLFLAIICLMTYIDANCNNNESQDKEYEAVKGSNLQSCVSACGLPSDFLDFSDQTFPIQRSEDEAGFAL